MLGILSGAWQQGVDDERERKEGGREAEMIDRTLVRRDAPLFPPLHDALIYFECLATAMCRSQKRTVPPASTPRWSVFRPDGLLVPH